MSTITPTSDQTQTRDCTVFQVGDVVREAVTNRIGTIIPPTRQPGDPVQLVASVPSPVPADPITNKVSVQWDDGTISIVRLDTLRKP